MHSKQFTEQWTLTVVYLIFARFNAIEMKRTQLEKHVHNEYLLAIWRRACFNYRSQSIVQHIFCTRNLLAVVYRFWNVIMYLKAINEKQIWWHTIDGVIYSESYCEKTQKMLANSQNPSEFRDFLFSKSKFWANLRGSGNQRSEKRKMK